jgi:hypothetical protein
MEKDRECRFIPLWRRRVMRLSLLGDYRLFGVTGSGGSADWQGEVLQGTRTRTATRADAENEPQRLCKHSNCSGASQGRCSVATEWQRYELFQLRRGRVSQAEGQEASRMTIWLDERRENFFCARELARQWRQQISSGNFGGGPSIARPRPIRRVSTCAHGRQKLESGGASSAVGGTPREESTRRLSQRKARKERHGNQGLKVHAGAMSLNAKRQCCDISRSNERCARLLGSEPIRSRAYVSLGEVQPVWRRETASILQANSAKTQPDTQAAAGCRPRAWSPVLFVAPRINESGGP